MVKPKSPVWEVIIGGGGAIFATILLLGLTFSILSLTHNHNRQSVRADQSSQPQGGNVATAQHPTRPANATSQAKTATAIRPDATASIPAPEIGMFVSNSADDPQAAGVLDKLHAMGVTVVYNYALIDGSAAQIQAYLNHANGLGLKVVISLKDLYDQLPTGATTASNHPEFGSTNEAIAVGIARRFGGHPAVWGFGLTDEAPMQPSDLGAWQPVLRDRYVKLKAVTDKPVMAVLVGKTSSDAAARRTFLSALKAGTDVFALDFYPIPFESTAIIESIGGDLAAIGDSNGWFVEQAFSWSRYASTAQGIGYNPAAARNPTTAEMVDMAHLALRGGARNIMYYSYFDIQDDPAQVAAVTAAIKQLR